MTSLYVLAYRQYLGGERRVPVLPGALISNRVCLITPERWKRARDIFLPLLTRLGLQFCFLHFLFPSVYVFSGALFPLIALEAKRG